METKSEFKGWQIRIKREEKVQRHRENSTKQDNGDSLSLTVLSPQSTMLQRWSDPERRMVEFNQKKSWFKIPQLFYITQRSVFSTTTTHKRRKKRIFPEIKTSAFLFAWQNEKLRNSLSFFFPLWLKSERENWGRKLNKTKPRD